MGSGLISLWRPTHGKLIYHLKGQSNSTNCLEVVGEQLISAATNGNIVIHTSFESSVSSPRVPSAQGDGGDGLAVTMGTINN